MSTALPAAKSVRDLLADLLGREVTVAPAAPFVASDIDRTLVALYVDDTGRMTALVGLDMPLAAFAGAAIGLVPRGGAEACVEDGELSPMIAENVAEVCNVLTTLYHRDGAPHLRLHQVHPPGGAVPGDAAAHLVALGQRLDLTVDVAGYGTGRMALVVTG